MQTITVEQLYERCEVLVSNDDSTSHYIQMYDEPLLEDDFGKVVYEFQEDEGIPVTDSGCVIINDVEYQPYTYKTVSKEYLLD